MINTSKRILGYYTGSTNNMKKQLEEEEDAQVGGLNIKIETSTRAILKLDQEILELAERRKNLEERKRTEEHRN